jgi:hypothetical protein
MAGRADPRALEQRVRELERMNAHLLRRLERLERAQGSGAEATDVAAPVAAAPEAPAPKAAAETESAAPGLTAEVGRVRATFNAFGDGGVGWENPPEGDTGHTSFAFGALDLFGTAQVGEHVQALAEIVFEGDSADNEVAVELERAWGSWTFADSLYLKFGREHSPQSRWNRRYHHGKWLWTSATQPFLARFEDDGGPLGVHQTGVEAGGHVPLPGGKLEYVGVVANGRGREATEVTNFGDRNDAKAYDLGLGFSPGFARGLTVGGNFHADEIPSVPGEASRRHAIRELVETAYVEHLTGKLETLAEYAWLQHDDRTSGRTFRHHAGYVQLGYHLGAFTPFARFDVRTMKRNDPFFAPADIDLDGWEQMVGVRYDVTDYLALKLEGAGGRAQARREDGRVGTRGFGRVAAQFALVF